MTNKLLIGLATAAYGLLCGLTGVFYLHFKFWKPDYTQLAGWAMLLLSAVLLLAFLAGVIRPNRPCLRTLVACAVLLMVLLFAACLGWLSYLGQSYEFLGAARPLSIRGVALQAVLIALGAFAARGNLKLAAGRAHL